MNNTKIYWIALAAFIALASMGFAEGSNDITVSADIPIIIEVTPPNPVSWTLRLGSNEFHDNDYYVYLLGNCRDPWSMYVSANRATMASASHPEDVLANGMNISFTGLGIPEEVSITTEPQKILSWEGIIGNSGLLTLTQDIILDDKPHNDYKMNITLTASVD